MRFNSDLINEQPINIGTFQIERRALERGPSWRTSRLHALLGRIVISVNGPDGLTHKELKVAYVVDANPEAGVRIVNLDPAEQEEFDALINRDRTRFQQVLISRFETKIAGEEAVLRRSSARISVGPHPSNQELGYSEALHAASGKGIDAFRTHVPSAQQVGYHLGTRLLNFFKDKQGDYSLVVDDTYEPINMFEDYRTGFEEAQTSSVIVADIPQSIQARIAGVQDAAVDSATDIGSV